jgi:hypothetical protein
VQISIPLDALADMIRKAHKATEKHKHDAVVQAATAGNHLLVAKQQVQHGQWEQWVADNCKFALRTAQIYMKIAKRLRELPPAKTQRVALLPLREALVELAAPDDDEPRERRTGTTTKAAPKPVARPVRVTSGQESVEVPAAKVRVILDALDAEGQKDTVPGSTVAHLAKLLRELLTTADGRMLDSIERIQFERAVNAEADRCTALRMQAEREELKAAKAEIEQQKQKLRDEIDLWQERNNHTDDYLTLDEFRLVQSCLHPDREADTERKARAFGVFKRLEARVNPDARRLKNGWKAALRAHGIKGGA